MIPQLTTWKSLHDPKCELNKLINAGLVDERFLIVRSSTDLCVDIFITAEAGSKNF